MERNVKIREFRLRVIDNSHLVCVYKIDYEKYLANPSSSQMETKKPPQKGFVKYFGIINLYIVLVLNAGLAELRPSQAGTPEINRFVPLRIDQKCYWWHVQMTIIHQDDSHSLGCCSTKLPLFPSF